MEKIITTLILQIKDQLLVIIVFLLYIIAFKLVPYMFNLWMKERDQKLRDEQQLIRSKEEEKERKEKEETRTKIDKIAGKIELEMLTKDDLKPIEERQTKMEEHLLKINGSIGKHHDDLQHHPDKNELATKAHCAEMREKLCHDMDTRMNDVVLEFSTKMADATQKLYKDFIEKQGT